MTDRQPTYAEIYRLHIYTPTHSCQCATIATAEWAKDGNLCTCAHLAYNPSPLTIHKQSVRKGGKTVHNFYTSF